MVTYPNTDAYKISVYCFTTGKLLTFPAFLTDFSDAFKLDLTSTPVYGRMDPITTYKNTTRTVSLAFDVPNASVQEAATNMLYIDTLIQSLYPIYSSENGMGKGTFLISSPPLFRIKFANLVSNASAPVGIDAGTLKQGLLGYMPSFDFKPRVDSGFFVDNVNNRLFPKLVAMNLTLNVIHEHPLGNVLTETGLRSRITKDGRNIGANTFPHQYGDVVNTRTNNTNQAGRTAATQREAVASDADDAEILG